MHSKEPSGAEPRKNNSSPPSRLRDSLFGSAKMKNEPGWWNGANRGERIVKRRESKNNSAIFLENPSSSTHSRILARVGHAPVFSTKYIVPSTKPKAPGIGYLVLWAMCFSWREDVSFSKRRRHDAISPNRTLNVRI